MIQRRRRGINEIHSIWLDNIKRRRKSVFERMGVPLAYRGDGSFQNGRAHASLVTSSVGFADKISMASGGVVCFVRSYSSLFIIESSTGHVHTMSCKQCTMQQVFAAEGLQQTDSCSFPSGGPSFAAPEETSLRK